MMTSTVAVIPRFDLEPRHFTRALPEITTPRRSRWGLPELFAVAQVAGPALLYLPGSQPFRAPLRVGVFAFSLMALIWCLRSARSTKVHPSWILLLIAGLYMVITLSHPGTNTVMAGLAQIGMHFAIAAPLFWAPHYFLGDYRRLLRLLTILWVLNGASTLVGIIQVRDPATWMPMEFSSISMNQKFGMAAYQYQLADGSMAVRPPGLGDSPGAACGAGTFVAIVGLAYLGLNVSRLRIVLGFLMGIAGIVVIFLCHVRSSLVVVVGCAVVYSIIMIGQRRLRTVLSLAVWVLICGVCAFLYAELNGGQSTINRFATLLADDPLTVYSKSQRMYLVTNTFDTLILEFPLGAGLGRWGMMRKYFGDENNTDSPEIWAEVQFTAWVLDGGAVVLTLYLLALILAIQRLIRSSLSHSSVQLRQWGAVLVMLSAGPIALLFSYCPFNSQTGIQFWLLIGAFEGLAQGEGRQVVAEDWDEASITEYSESCDVHRLVHNHG